MAILFISSTDEILAQQTGGRSIILDASGSMENRFSAPGFERNNNRFDAAKRELDRFLKEKEFLGDRLKTEIMVYGTGADYSTEILGRKINGRTIYDSKDYPVSGKFCARDTLSLTQSMPEIPSRSFRTRIARELKSKRADGRPYKAGGLTPLYQSITKSLDYLKPFKGGEIVLISDYDVANCIPRNTNICTLIKDKVEDFKKRVGNVDIHVIKIAAGPQLDALAECIGVKSIRNAVGGGTSKVQISAQYTRPVADGSTPDLRDIELEINDPAIAAGNTKFKGKFGPVNLERGRYTATAAFGNSSSSKRFEVPKSAPVILPVEPGLIVVQVTGISGAGKIRLFNKNTGAEIASRPTNGNDSGSFALAPGIYQANAKISGRTISGMPVTLNFGQKKLVHLNFDTGGTAPQTNLRQVRVSLNQINYSLTKFSSIPLPQVSRFELVDSTGKIETGNVFRVLPGKYRFRVILQNGPIFEQELEIVGSSSVFEITFDLAPGRLDARAMQNGNWTLIDAGGEKTYFRGDRIVHLLPSGTYSLEFRPNSGSKSTKSINIQDGTVLIRDF